MVDWLNKFADYAEGRLKEQVALLPQPPRVGDHVWLADVTHAKEITDAMIAHQDMPAGPAPIALAPDVTFATGHRNAYLLDGEGHVFILTGRWEHL